MENNKTGSDTFDTEEKLYNFLINSINQTNLTGLNNVKSTQLSSVFIFIEPYTLESCNIEELDLNIKIDDNGTIWLNNQPFKPVEVKPGITVFGITKEGRGEEDGKEANEMP